MVTKRKVNTMAIKLCIGGLPICGAIGKDVTIAISVQDCLSAYCKWVHRLAEKDAPLCVLRTAKWTINNVEIEEPKAWFLVMTDIQP